MTIFPIAMKWNADVINDSLRSALEQFAVQERLPPAYLQTVEQWFLPLAQDLLRRVSTRHEALVVGVSGCQGSGKSTLAALLVLLLKELLGLKAVNLSIDDFYLTHAERQQLGQSVHPLLATRGVPGTHDVALAVNTITSLRSTGPVAIPRFDKAVDDRAPRSIWPQVLAPVDVIVLEGWCLSIGPQSEAELQQPINALEEGEDPDGAWRRYVNAILAEDYVPLYDLVDYLIMLKAPDFAQVFEWRQQQEDKLAAKQGAGESSRIMNQDQLRRFIQHYERITRHGLATLPERADVVFQLTPQQTIAGKLKG
jgi:D-glycerate 3-kinase